MNAVLIGIIFGIILLFLFKLIGKDSKFSNLGINLNRVYCPKCNERQPIVRKPKNKRQAIFGGHTCRSCGTEMDKFGTELEK